MGEINVIKSSLAFRYTNLRCPKDIQEMMSDCFLSLSLSLSHHTCSVMSNTCEPWTVAHKAPLSMGFFRQEYWSGLPFPTPGIFQTQGLKAHLLHLLHWQADSLPLHTLKKSLAPFPVAQWLGFRLPMQGMEFDHWSES